MDGNVLKALHERMEAETSKARPDLAEQKLARGGGGWWNGTVKLGVLAGKTETGRWLA